MDRAKLAAGLVLTAPFLPLLFQGDEFAASTPFLYFADHEDPEMARAVSAGRRREFAAFGFAEQEIPDPKARETFERSRLNWDEVHEGAHSEMLDWYRQLIHLRRKSPSLNDGDIAHVSVAFDEAKRWLLMDRGNARVLLNLGPEAAGFDVPEGMGIALASRHGLTALDSRISLPPDTLAVLSREAE
jgi:maltooligosyltrehalose trehalohydrolase